MQAVHGIGSPLPDPIDRLALLKHENRENGTTAHSPEQLSSSSAELDSLLKHQFKGFHRIDEIPADLDIWLNFCALLGNGATYKSKKLASQVGSQAVVFLRLCLDPLLRGQENENVHASLPQKVQAIATCACISASQSDKQEVRNVVKELLHIVEDCLVVAVRLKRDEKALRYMARVLNGCLWPMTRAFEELSENKTYLCQSFVHNLHKMAMRCAELADNKKFDGKAQFWLNIVFKKVEDPEALLVWLLIDHIATIMASSWRSHPSQSQQELYFMEIASTEKFAILAAGHSIYEKLQGDEQFCRVIIPLFTDMMSLPTSDLDVANYVVAAHVLGSMAAISANNKNLWGYTAVIDQFCKLYKFPKHRITAALMHGLASHSSERGPQIRGKAPGTFADALLLLADSIKAAPLEIRKDLRRRLLLLFSDFALLMPNDTYIADLGSLLPAVASSVSSIKAPFVMGRISSALSSGDLSLEALNKLQEDSKVHTSAFRHLWFCSAVYDFASFQASGGPNKWPKAWIESLNIIASRTPILLIGSEQQQESVFLDHIAAEFSGWIHSLGRRGESKNLILYLSETLKVQNRTMVIRDELVCHLLTVAYLSISHAAVLEFPMPIHRCPIDAVIVHSQFSLPSSTEYEWYKSILRASFSKYLIRLIELSHSSNNHHQGYAMQASKYAVGVMVESLVQQGPNVDLPLVMVDLLKSIFPVFPNLYYSREVIFNAIKAVTVDREYLDFLANGTSHKTLVADPRAKHTTSSIASSYLLDLIEEAATQAPSTTESVVAENLREMASLGGQTAGFISRITPAVMDAIEIGRRMCSLPETSGPYKSVVAWSAKIRAVGIVEGLKSSSSGESEIVSQLCKQLLSKIRDHASNQDLSDGILELAAGCVAYPESPAVEMSLQLLAWAPLSNPCEEIMQSSCLGWNWILSTEANCSCDLIDFNITAWLSSQNLSMGIFDKDQELENKGDGDINDILRAQRAWIVFLTEVWRSRKQGASMDHCNLMEQYLRLARCIKGANKEQKFSNRASCCSARFGFLNLMLEFIKSSFNFLKVDDPSNRKALLETIFRNVVHCDFSWFSAPVAWYEAQPEESYESYQAVKRHKILLSDVYTTIMSKVLNSAEYGLLSFLLEIEVERLKLWAKPLADVSMNKQPSIGWRDALHTAWRISPTLAFAIGTRFPGAAGVQSSLESLVVAHALEPEIQQFPQAVKYLATAQNSPKRESAIQFLGSWAPIGLEESMSLMAMPIARNPSFFTYIRRCLELCDPNDVSFFLPQLVQLLRHDPDKGVEGFLLEAAARSPYFAFLLKCQLISEGTPPAEAFSPEVKRSNWAPPSDTGLWSIADTTLSNLNESLHGDVKNHLDAESEFFDSVTAVSGKLYPISKEERKAAAIDFLREIEVQRDDLFMPFDANTIIKSIKPETAAPMQSAAKCPILVAFDVVHQNTRSSTSRSMAATNVEAAIFKVGDDCRQDVLALQVVELLKKKFDDIGLPLHLVPYGVIPTGHECGIIQVVPNSKSRAQLGEVTDGGLLDVFQNEFGLPGSARFESARAAFIESSAAYAIVSYILQAKDRHNGNIMIDNHGRLIHIDFGYILGISPGGNMGFESAAFKLSYEMTELLDPGNTRNSIHFLRFQELCVKGYLAARTMADSIVATVQMMVPSKLPCFSRGAPVESLRERFHLEMSDAEAANFMRALILDAYDKWTTGVYDLIQYYQNRIPK